MKHDKGWNSKRAAFRLIAFWGWLFFAVPQSPAFSQPPPQLTAPDGAKSSPLSLKVESVISDSQLMIGRPFLLTYRVANQGRQVAVVSTDDKAASFITLRFSKPGQSGVVAPATFMTVTRQIQNVTLPSNSDAKTSGKVVIKDWSKYAAPGDYTMEVTLHFRAQASGSSESPAASEGEAVVCSSSLPVTVLPQTALPIADKAVLFVKP